MGQKHRDQIMEELYCKYCGKQKMMYYPCVDCEEGLEDALAPLKTLIDNGENKKAIEWLKHNYKQLKIDDDDMKIQESQKRFKESQYYFGIFCVLLILSTIYGLFFLPDSAIQRCVDGNHILTYLFNALVSSAVPLFYLGTAVGLILICSVPFYMLFEDRISYYPHHGDDWPAKKIKMLYITASIAIVLSVAIVRWFW